MERTVSDDTRQFMIMAIVKTHQNLDKLVAEEIASISMMDDEDLIYEIGEESILLSKYVTELINKQKEILRNETIMKDGSI